MTLEEVAKVQAVVDRARDYAKRSTDVLDAFPNKIREYLFDTFGPLDFEAKKTALIFTTKSPDSDGKHMQGVLEF